MESVVYEDSPLADYLEGRGEASTIDAEVSPHSPAFQLNATASSFAPSSSSTVYARYRKRVPAALRLHIRSTSKSINRLRDACTGLVNGRLGRDENAAFLERFRYTIIASDLLNEHHQAYAKRQENLCSSTCGEDPTLRPGFSSNGALGITGASFVLAASIAWVRSVPGHSGLTQLAILVLLLVIGGMGLGSFARRKWLQRIRAQAADRVTAFATNAQAFDAALSATLTIIQEVELVARGYRISTPLPPASRLEDQGQHRRCGRLRTTAARAILDVLQPVAIAARLLEGHAAPDDLERYHDIYEITRTNVEEVEQMSYIGALEGEESESLKGLRIGMQQLFLARKLLLCDLLALDADGTKSDYTRWTFVAKSLEDLSQNYGRSAVALDALLSDEERFTIPATPKMPLSPGRERARVQIRKLGGLSSGIRGLQAKMHLIREEADKHLDSAEDSGELSASLMSQYEAIGQDLRALLQEWEEGKAALTHSNHKRQSISSAGFLSPRAETPTSLSGTTANGGSPADALRALNGEALSPRFDATSSDEEVFEAIAIPRQRSALTREERIVKMREDRDVREKARESRQAGTNMLRELETVLKHKPQASKSARRVTVM